MLSIEIPDAVRIDHKFELFIHPKGIRHDYSYFKCKNCNVTIAMWGGEHKKPRYSVEISVVTQIDLTDNKKRYYNESETVYFVNYHNDIMCKMLTCQETIIKEIIE